MLHRAKRAKIPLVFVKVAFRFYFAPRVLQNGKEILPSMFFAVCGFPAGDIFADVAIAVFVIEAFDQFIVEAPSASSAVWFDDLVLSGLSTDERKLANETADNLALLGKC